MSHVLKKFIKEQIDPANVQKGFLILGVSPNDVKLNAQLQLYYGPEKVSLAINRNGLKTVGLPLPIYSRVDGIGINITDGKVEIVADHTDVSLIQGLENLLGSLNTLGSNYQELLQAFESQNMKMVLEPYSNETGTIQLRLVQGEGSIVENENTSLW